MKDRYNLSRNENIFLAKKTLKESIYSGIKLEGSPITFPETETILDGVNVGNVDLDDIQRIFNLRDAWKELLKNIDQPLTLDYALKLNGFVARNESLDWGVLRTGNVGIGGTDYQPELPERKNVEQEFSAILSSDDSITKQAIHLFLYNARAQLFWDGNKRTSMLLANKHLIMNGKGVFTIPEKILLEFHKRLTAFYETNDYSKVDQFLYDNCIIGIDFPKDKKRNTMER